MLVLSTYSEEYAVSLKVNNITHFKPFYLDEYMSQTVKQKTKEEKIFVINKDKYSRFEDICGAVKDYFQSEWDHEPGDKEDKYSKLLDRQKNAIIGYEKEVSFFKDKINDYLRANNLLNEWHPDHYISLIDAIYEENWGLAGIAQWKYMKESSSAKIIGHRIYFLKGKQILQKQKISSERVHQLITALLLRDPKLRIDKNYAEVYMLDGTRITIFLDGLAKQTAIVFRKYIVPNLSFEEQAKRKTIPEDSIHMFKAMVGVGFNVAFTGPVRTAKTTFLQTWQLHEDPSLEGLMVETDPEIPLHTLMPDAPIIQLLADGADLEGIVKSIMRSDADYIIIAEARDGIALNIAVKVANKGTRRVKITFHTTDTIDFCYDIADEIQKIYGGSVYSHIIKVAKSFQYVFQFVQLKNKSQKRLKGIYEIRYEPIDHRISVHQICKYRNKTDDWVFAYDIGKDKELIGEEEDPGAFQIFKAELKRLAEKYPYPDDEDHTFYPAYDHLRKGG